MTTHASSTPAWARMLREYTLSLALAATVAAITDWRDVRLELPGATTMIIANIAVAAFAAAATALFLVKWPGEQRLPLALRVALILLGPMTVAALYMFAYPLFW